MGEPKFDEVTGIYWVQNATPFANIYTNCVKFRAGWEKRGLWHDNVIDKVSSVTKAGPTNMQIKATCNNAPGRLTLDRYVELSLVAAWIVPWMR